MNESPADIWRDMVHYVPPNTYQIGYLQCIILEGHSIIELETMTNNAQVKTGLDTALYLIIGRPLDMLSGRYAEEGEKLCSIHFAWKPCRMKLWTFEIFVYREMNNKVDYEVKIYWILNFLYVEFYVATIRNCDIIFHTYLRLE